ncbi:LysR family transcriptional regulator [Aerophototrophica crusticola]|uniref:LysR family transcriptional regulator n=1 Tax=Aerophototrophica crusticola TaxID=1709002 RepID=A0A858R766_9PROT|nr:LysR family transcriptional regulator [Rhodospirillaceae bacterium B3]
MGTRNLDLDLLRTFVAIVDLGGFTRAAERLGRTQSTISLQVKRLEDSLGQDLFRRVGRGVQLTAEGELLLGYARRMLHLNDEVRARLTEPEVEGTVRLGTPEDFATVHLPGVLAAFAEAHPRVQLEVRCDFTMNLLEAFDRNEFDLVLVKREPRGPSDGALVWREPLVWAAAGSFPTAREGSLPLVLHPAPDVYRKRALAALDGAGLSWRIAYTSPSLAGTQAAVRAGLGATVLPRDMVPTGLRVLGAEHGLPDLAEAEIALRTVPSASRAATMLAESIIQGMEQRG